MPITRNFPLEISEYNATTKCRECEVFIGIGHHDATPMPSYDGEGFLCRACVRAQSRRRQPGWRAVIWTD